jgi:hypothetical protein
MQLKMLCYNLIELQVFWQDKGPLKLFTQKVTKIFFGALKQTNEPDFNLPAFGHHRNRINSYWSGRVFLFYDSFVCL